MKPSIMKRKNDTLRPVLGQAFFFIRFVAKNPNRYDAEALDSGSGYGGGAAVVDTVATEAKACSRWFAFWGASFRCHLEQKAPSTER